MSTEPMTSSWEFDRDRFIPVVKVAETNSSPVKQDPQNNPFILVALFLALAIAGATFTWLLGKANNEWQETRETNAQTELAHIRSRVCK